MPSYIFMISFLLLIPIITVESSYYAYTYDKGVGDDEHCCLIRSGEDFHLAKPLTRSLLQVNKQNGNCGCKQKTENYLDKIVRRLNVESSKKLGDKVLVELKDSIDKSILADDLLCLATDNNNLNLEKCHIDVPPVKPKKLKKKKQNKTVDEEESVNENQVQQVEVDEPVLIRKGRGLSVRETYELNISNIHIPNRKQRDCWTWYRKNTKDVLNFPTKSQKACVPLNDQQEKCLEQLFYKKGDDDQEESYEKNSIKSGSKLFCENNKKQIKLLGIYQNSELCFTTHYQAYVEHKFTDLVSLSDVKNNKDVLQYIASNTKLTSEFESDCNDKDTLANTKKELEEEEKEKAEAEAKAVDDKATADDDSKDDGAAVDDETKDDADDNKSD